MDPTEDVLQSSQSFVRALKSTTDPPHENGPTKIQIARMGWESCTLYVPRKAGLILEWMFTRFHKEKSRPGNGHENPLLDIDHWSLLADIVASPGDTQIEPIIFRASVPALVASFIGLYPTVPVNARPRLLSPLLRALNILWPLSMQRTALDSLAECLWPSLAIADQLSNVPDHDGLVGILDFVLTGYRASFDKANAAGRKKAYTAIFQDQFLPWLTALHRVPPTHPLHHLIYSVGVDIIYNSDSLRTFLENNPKTSTSDLFSSILGPFTSPDPIVRSSLLRLLPKLYNDYVAALYKHRSSLFSSTPPGQQTHERIRLAALRFGDECLASLKNMGKEEMQESVWKTILEVLQVTEKEALVDLAENDTYIMRIKEVGEDALRHLDQAWDSSQSPLSIHALDLHSCLQRIHPELAIQFLPRILERIVTAPPEMNRSLMTFLNQITSYYSKTRTLHSFISHLLSALTSSFPYLHSSDPQATYVMCVRSPLLSLPFMDELTNALHAFVTPGQGDEMVRLIMEALESFLSLPESSEVPERKRRKLLSGDKKVKYIDHMTDFGLDVIKFALVARLGATTLTMVLHKRVDKDALQKEKRCLSSLDGSITNALHVAFHPEDAVGNTSTRILGKRSHPEIVHESEWTHQCRRSVILRLWYELFTERGMARMNMETNEDWVATGTLDHLNHTFRNYMSQDIFPELHLEIGRVLFARKASEWQQLDKEWPAFDSILDYVEVNLLTSGACPTDSNSSPSQGPYFLKQHSALGLWGLMLDRYLSTIDLHASQHQLSRFVRLMIRVHVDSPLIRPGQHPPAATILQRALTSASFWEFINLRMAMLSVLDKQTSVFGLVDAKKWMSFVSAGKDNSLDSLSKMDRISSADVEAGVGVYSFLHYFPPEFLSRASRVDLATKALNADILVRAFNPNTDPTSPNQVEWRAILRAFVVKIAKQSQMKFVDDLASSFEWMSYLTLSNHGPVEPSLTYIQATLEILSLVQISAARGASKTEGTLLISVLTHFLPCNLYSNGLVCNQPLAHRSLLQFINMLVREFNVSSFQESVLSMLRQLCASLEEQLRSAIGRTIDHTTPAEFLASEWIIEGWQALMTLKNRFSIELSCETFGQRLLMNTTRIIRSGASETLVSDKFRATILSVLATEGQSLPESDCRHVMGITAAYLCFTTVRSQPGTFCDIPISHASKLFSVTQYQCALELVAEGLQDGPNDERQLITLIRISTLFLREAPERTSKLSRDHISRCLRIFVNRPAFRACSSMLTTGILDFVKFQCTERAASLNALDVACILSIVSKSLVGCSEHDERSSPSIFQIIVSVLNALVRLRRDLLGPLLPQLSMVLRQLFSLVRGVRPLLGVKQYRIVADTFPKWINPIDPLRETEANSLARLLTAFTTKSFVRSHGNETQKADSLARPFARHAPYVLLSYLQLMNDPLSVLSASMRRELEPGLFALCAMVGENGRDTLMVQSLDIGGKALLKSLWKEYGKQRYIGRG